MVKNLFEGIPEALSEELVTVLASSGTVRIERIVSAGQASPAGFWHDQPDDEWVLLLAGSATLAFEDASVLLSPGDHLMIPAHRRHRVEATAPAEKTIWLALFFPSETG